MSNFVVDGEDPKGRRSGTVTTSDPSHLRQVAQRFMQHAHANIHRTNYAEPTLHTHSLYLNIYVCSKNKLFINDNFINELCKYPADII